MKPLSLKRILQEDNFPFLDDTDAAGKRLVELQLKMLKVQQGIWHQKKRAIIVFEGFDAAGKGGAIRRLVEMLDPRGYTVHPVGAPDPLEQSKHFLYRFWKKIPAPGALSIFDRSWYGRVLVERVERLTPKHRWKDAYNEILEFEKMLTKDGVDVIKIFLAISKSEQLRRYEDRLRDPYKQWKLTLDDVKARMRWKEYVDAVDDMFLYTHTNDSQWHLIPADDKHHARIETLKIVTSNLNQHSHWIESKAQKKQKQTLKSALGMLGIRSKKL